MEETKFLQLQYVVIAEGLFDLRDYLMCFYLLNLAFLKEFF
jgi:hypothetical protein